VRDDVVMGTDLFDTAPLDFVCPRCALPASARFYGPCEDCRDAMRATLGSAPREVEADTYEPKMNVVPNSVATKD
jgi:hypothetical protein